MLKKKTVSFSLDCEAVDKLDMLSAITNLKKSAIVNMMLHDINIDAILDQIKAKSLIIGNEE